MQLDLLVNVALEEFPDFHYSVVEVVMTNILAGTNPPSGLT